MTAFHIMTTFHSRLSNICLLKFSFPFFFLILSAAQIHADGIPGIESRINLSKWTLLPGAGTRSSIAFPSDPITHSLVSGTFQYPVAGDTVAIEAGKQAVWTDVTGPEKGALSHSFLLGGWAYTKINSSRARRAVLHAKGHSIVYVNNRPRAGNIYRYDYSMIPVLLKKGDNHFLFKCVRFGTIEAWLMPATHDVMINMADATLPEAVKGETRSYDAGIVFLNTTTNPINLAAAQGAIQSGKEGNITLPSRWLYPMSLAKLPVKLSKKTAGGKSVAWKIGGKHVQPAEVEIAVVEPDAFRKVTFCSKVEGSVQYYGYRPPRQPNSGGPFAMMLHLHGASDEATAYRNLYLAKPWCAIASATNRRPYGFNWESLGRIDALEVLAHANTQTDVDPARIYLGGHSMGGHGVWQIAGHHPGRFAAIGPGAGWQDVWTYSSLPTLSANPSPVQKLLDSCANPSRTALLVDNYRHHGVLIIHGDADSVVSIQEAYRIRDLLKNAGHDDLTMVIEPGGGHVYDTTPEQGHSCFDLRELFDFFQRHCRPAAPQRVCFTTVDPSINDRCYWAGVEQQKRPRMPSHLNLQFDPGRRWLHGTLENVHRFSVDPSLLMTPGEITVQLDDGKEIKTDWSNGALYFENSEEGWQEAAVLERSRKGPHRNGPFKDVFLGNNPILVVASHGTEEENAWALEKACFDNENLWYRGNASYEIVMDREFRPSEEPHRNVVLYGNRNTNSAWNKLLGKTPVDVTEGEITVGDTVFSDSDLACLFIRPRPGSDTACVGAVSGTNLAGMRATNELGFFSAVVHFPDFVVFSSKIWETGDKAVLAAGFFDNSWNLSPELAAFSE
jgi:poly(3-hydroxybutyrate) depolymerase